MAEEDPSKEQNDVVSAAMQYEQTKVVADPRHEGAVALDGADVQAARAAYSPDGGTKAAAEQYAATKQVGGVDATPEGFNTGDDSALRTSGGVEVTGADFAAGSAGYAPTGAQEVANAAYAATKVVAPQAPQGPVGPAAPSTGA